MDRLWTICSCNCILVGQQGGGERNIAGGTNAGESTPDLSLVAIEGKPDMGERTLDVSLLNIEGKQICLKVPSMYHCWQLKWTVSGVILPVEGPGNYIRYGWKYPWCIIVDNWSWNIYGWMHTWLFIGDEWKWKLWAEAPLMHHCWQLKMEDMGGCALNVSALVIKDGVTDGRQHQIVAWRFLNCRWRSKPNLIVVCSSIIEGRANPTLLFGDSSTMEWRQHPTCYLDVPQLWNDHFRSKDAPTTLRMMQSIKCMGCVSA